MTEADSFMDFLVEMGEEVRKKEEGGENYGKGDRKEPSFSR